MGLNLSSRNDDTPSSHSPENGFNGGGSISTTKSHHMRQPSIRTKQPMPDPNELEKRFTKVLVRKFLNLELKCIKGATV